MLRYINYTLESKPKIKMNCIIRLREPTCQIQRTYIYPT